VAATVHESCRRKRSPDGCSASADSHQDNPQHPAGPRTHPQVKIPARGGKLPGTYQGRRGPCPLRGAVTAQGPSRAAHLHPSGVAAGHEPLTMEPPGTAVRTTIPAGNARPSGSKLSVLLRPSYVLCRDGRQAQLLADPKTDDDAYTGRPSLGRDLFPRDRAGLVAAAETWRQRCSSSRSWPGCVASPTSPDRPGLQPSLM
jgi:hypothetical protein